MDSGNAYIYTGSKNTPAEQVNLSTGAITYLVTDALGSIRGTVNGSGTVTGTASYDAWGNPETPGGLSAVTPFGFAGGYTDPDGLVYLIGRYYDPQTGQFTSLDPDVDQSMAPYAYTGGDPVDQTDPTGLSSFAPCDNNISPSCNFWDAANYTYGRIIHFHREQAFADVRNYMHEYEHATGPGTAAKDLYHALITFAGQVKTCGEWDLKRYLKPSSCSPSSGSGNALNNASSMGTKEKYEAAWWSRVDPTHQIGLQVWGNVLFSWLGMDAGIGAPLLQGGPELLSLLGQKSFAYEANHVERQMGIDYFNQYGGTVNPWYMGILVMQESGEITGDCALMPYPMPKSGNTPNYCLNHPEMGSIW
jgi:RHS repeat-associated protein